LFGEELARERIAKSKRGMLLSMQRYAIPCIHPKSFTDLAQMHSRAGEEEEEEEEGTVGWIPVVLIYAERWIRES
jgi:hypothetical protein